MKPHRSVAALTALFAALSGAEAALAQDAAPQQAANPQAQAPTGARQDPGSDEEITVTASRPPGSIPGDARPELTLNAGEVRSYGTSSVPELLAAISTQTGSASRRGGGVPVVLVNGRRISGFQEIRDLPTEAIARVEVFSEEVALQFGFSPDQRVVNLVLRRFFTVNTAELAGSSSADDARSLVDLDLSRVELDRGSRVALAAGIDRSTAITERERDILPPLVGTDSRFARTLSPETLNRYASANVSHALNEQITGTGTLRIESEEAQSLLGLNADGSRIARDSETTRLRVSGAFDGSSDGWQWTTTAAATLENRETKTQSTLSPQTTTSDSTLVELNANATGALMELPAGALRGNIRLGLDRRDLSSISETLTTFRNTDLDRTAISGRVGLTAPLTSRRSGVGEAFGDFSLNVTATAEDLSDAGGLAGFGGGAAWSPIPGLRFSVQAEQSQSAPSLQQLGDPAQTTAGVTVFDIQRGQSAVVTLTSGGLSTLRNEDRQDVIVNANWQPDFLAGLTLSLNYARNQTDDAIVPLPTALTQSEAAFPTRFSRNGSGALIGLDTRPVNLARRETETLRYGFSFSQTFGTWQRAPQGQPPWGAGLPPWGSGPPPWGSGPPPWERQGGGQGGPPGAGGQGGPPAGGGQGAPGGGQGGPGAGGGGGGGGFFGGGGAGRGGPPPAGRWNISVFHVARLADDATLRPGLPSIDLLERGGLSGDGDAKNTLEFEGGIAYRGLGLRLNGAYAGSRTLRSLTGGDIEFSDNWTLNARAFVNFDQQAELLAAVPFLRGSRMSLGVTNLTDSTPDVRDSTGATPTAYQDGYLSPQGRVLSLSFRKQF